MNLKDVQQEAAECTLCDLHKGRITPVFDKGNPEARIMICGMVPAHDENMAGLPFVGRAGKLLDIILEDLELTLDDVYITNLVKCFVAAGNKLDQRWVRTCLPYLVSQIGIVRPQIIITLGADASNACLGQEPKTSIGSLRGRLHKWADGTLVTPTYHPSFLLRNGGQKSPYYEKVIDDIVLGLAVLKERDEKRIERFMSAILTIGVDRRV